MRRSSLLQKAAATLFTEPIAVSADGDDVAVVQEPIEDSCRTIGSPKTEPHSLTARLEVTGIAPSLTTADQLEEQMRGVELERQIATFNDDQWLRLGVVAEPLLEAPLGIGLG